MSATEGNATHAGERIALNKLPVIPQLEPAVFPAAQDLIPAAIARAPAVLVTESVVPATAPVAPAIIPAAIATAPASPASGMEPALAEINPMLTTDTVLARNDLWQRIRNGYAMHELNSPLIARHEQWYASRPDYMARMTERSQRYLHYIVDEVEKRGMPTEIALLPMIESAFNPSAYSIGHASGIWQFIPSTGRNFGLQQNWWYDGRRDIVSATNGALDYLQKLHDMFGDWELALAAYNWGEGSVQRAQERNRKRGLPTNYASLKMPDETRNYVPKLLAIKNIVSNPEKFGLVLQAIPNQPYFTTVTTARHIDVKLAAKLADISQDEFSALNPAHNRPVILQKNDAVLLLPVDKADAFRANLERYSESLVSWQSYQSKKGERLDRVAPRFGLSLANLKSINGLPSRAKLSNGQVLLVPLNGAEADNEFEAFNTHFVPDARMRGDTRTPGRTLTHTVKKGETLSILSRRYHVSLAKLQDWNSGVSQLQPGQRITIVQAGKARKLHRVAPRRLARSGKNPINLANASRSKKHGARKSPHRVIVASSR